MSLSRHAQTARLLAASVIGGAWEAGPLAQRIKHALSLRGLKPERLAGTLIRHFGESKTPALADLAKVIAADRGFKLALERTGKPEWLRMGIEPPRMGKPEGNIVTFPLPELNTLKDLCAWLEIERPTLEWLADTRKEQARVKDFRLLHYSYVWKRRRGKTPRLIESPKRTLKTVQKKILAQILNKIPPHEAAHGFCRGRSIVTHALLHSDKENVACFDLKDFFHSVPPARIAALFRALGYPREISRLLTNLCIHSPNPQFLGPNLNAFPFPVRKKILSPHLPQGAPTSPALANLCAFGLDVRLQSLAESMSMTYSRYADDLTFSGGLDLKRQFSYLRGTLSEIAAQEDFALNPEKTRLMTAAQRQTVTGIVVNRHPNMSRAEYDRLKASLHAGATGRVAVGTLEKQRLRGQIEFARALNPGRAEKLLRLWERIV